MPDPLADALLGETVSPVICETVAAETMADLRRARDAAGGDMVEVRLDGVRDADAAAAVQGSSRPVLVTCRPVWEGGRYEGSEEDRGRLLRAALRAGARYVDVEWLAPFRDALVRETPDRVVLSRHDFEGLPADLPALAREMAGAGAAVVKIAVLARRLRDMIGLLAVARDLQGRTPVVLIAMGVPGVASRVLAGRFGSRWTYAGPAIAPGQIDRARLEGEFRYRRIGPRTAVYGVVGRPIAHSASPAMHNGAFDATGVDAVFLPFEAEDFADFDDAARALGLHGAAVTAPFKRDAWAACSSRDQDAERLGAVNTLRRRDDGGWAGLNTDVAGFLAPLRVRGIAARRAAVLGAGGAARAVAAGLARLGARVHVHARRPEAAGQVAAVAGGVAGPWPPPAGSWDLLVNTTPVGTTPDVEGSPLSPEALDGRLVYDLVYNPPDTRLLRDARARGLETIGGLEMLVAQAAEQFTWWTGLEAPVDVMHAAALARLHAATSRDAEHAGR